MSTKQLKAAIRKARKQYGRITPCCNKKWDECWNEHDGVLYFWFNSSDHSTRCVKIKTNN